MHKRIDTKIKIQISLALIAVFCANFILVKADTVDDLATQKANNQRRLDDLNRQIKNYQQQINQAQTTSNTLKSEISIFDAQIASMELQIQAKQTQIEDTSLQITELEKLIDQKNKEIEENRKILGQLIVQLNEYDGQYALKTTIGSDNLSDFLDQIHYTGSIQDKVYQLVQRIKDLKARMEKQQQELRIQLKNLQDLKEQLEITQSELNSQRSQKQQLLTQTKGLEKNFQKLLASSKAEEANIEKEINDLDDQIRAKLGNRTIAASKGMLAWPMDGILTQGFGNTGFTALGYNYHNGIDIAAPAGQPIYAAADGTVLATDSSDTAYGNWVAIKHTLSTKNGQRQIITLYGHMRTIKARAGQQVSQGDIIGYEGNTGNTTKKLYGPGRGYHLHFSVFDVEGFGIKDGAYSRTYGPYKLPYGYIYNPLDFLSK